MRGSTEGERSFSPVEKGPSITWGDMATAGRSGRPHGSERDMPATSMQQCYPHPGRVPPLNLSGKGQHSMPRGMFPR